MVGRGTPRCPQTKCFTGHPTQLRPMEPDERDEDGKDLLAGLKKKVVMNLHLCYSYIMLFYFEMIVHFICHQLIYFYDLLHCNITRVSGISE